MRKQTLTTQNKKDHQIVSAHYYHVESPRGLFVVFHGMAEHKARYSDLANTMVDAGYCVLLCDHRGHGTSLFDGKVKGYFADQDGWMRNLEDLSDLIEQAKRLSLQSSIMLLGHSMGSIVARSYFKRNNHTISHLVLVGVPAIPNHLFLSEKLIRFLARFNPKKPSKLLYKTSFAAFDKKAKANHPLSWLSHDPKVVAAYKDDPLCGFYFSKQGFADLTFGLKDIAKVHQYPSNAHNTKVCVVVGEDDVTIDVNQIQQLIEALQHKGYPNPTVRLIPNAAHEVLFEANKEHLWQQIVRFISQ